MNVGIILAQIETEAAQTLTDTQMIQRIHEVVKNAPPGALRLILLFCVVSLVGILWLVHRQQKLARNQVKLAVLLEELAKDLVGNRSS